MATQQQDQAIAPTPEQAGRLLGWLLLGAVLTAGLLMLLPNREYYRWQQGDGTILFRARHVYERIHFDKRPIDIAMIGSSRMEASVRAEEVSAGLSKALGRPVHVVNFGMPQEGRDLAWTVAQQVLDNRPETKLIVLIGGPEAVISHPGFRFLGDDASIVEAPAFYNPKYANNLLTVPYRHLAYFVQGLWPEAFGLNRQFDAARYKALDFDPTKSFRMPYGTLIDRDASLPPEQRAQPYTPVHPGRYYDAKLKLMSLDQAYATERHFTRMIARHAREKNVAVAFLSVPIYRGGTEIYDDLSFYTQIGPVISASFLADDADNYMDTGHLNRTGTAAITPWLVDQLAPIYRKAEEKR